MKRWTVVPMLLALTLTVGLAPQASANHTQDAISQQRDLVKQDRAALVDAQQLFNNAEQDYREAVRLFGESSFEAIDANFRLGTAGRAVARAEDQLSRDLQILENLRAQAKADHQAL
jgi:hypothetical protein